MSLLRDIYEIGSDLKSAIKSGKPNNTKGIFTRTGNGAINVNVRYGSIRNVSKKNIAQFPVVCTRGINIETARMLVGSLESDYSVMMYLSIDSILKHGESYNSASDVLDDFHTDYSDDVAILSRNIRESVINGNKALLAPDGDSFIVETLNSLTDGSIINENEVKSLGGKKYQGASLLKDGLVKKVNESVPTLMQLDIRLAGDNSQAIPVVIGVKTVLHPVTPDEIVENLTQGIASNRGFFNFIKATTGEISFLKDYIFAYDKIKKEALSNRTQSRWWNVLRRRAKSDKLAKFFNNKGFIPNATIVLSIEEADELLNKHKINLFDKGSFDRLFREYLLLGIVIVDETNSVAHIAYDGDTEFEPYSFTSLQGKKNNPSDDIKSALAALKLK